MITGSNVRSKKKKTIVNCNGFAKENLRNLDTTV